MAQLRPNCPGHDATLGRWKIMPAEERYCETEFGGQNVVQDSDIGPEQSMQRRLAEACQTTLPLRHGPVHGTYSL